MFVVILIPLILSQHSGYIGPGIEAARRARNENDRQANGVTSDTPLTSSGDDDHGAGVGFDDKDSTKHAKNARVMPVSHHFDDVELQ